MGIFPIIPRTATSGKSGSLRKQTFFRLQGIVIDLGGWEIMVQGMNLKDTISLKEMDGGILWKYGDKPSILVKSDGFYGVSEADKKYLENQAFIIASVLFSNHFLFGTRIEERYSHSESEEVKE